MGRKKWYESLDEMQKDLDVYFTRYNTKRPHQGRNMNGMTPREAFKKGSKTTPKSKRKPQQNKAA
tara:strand:- start:49 stop:243 length:195 start_codon:yes stop_codon:yes gene_type:complete